MTFKIPFDTTFPVAALAFASAVTKVTGDTVLATNFPPLATKDEDDESSPLSDNLYDPKKLVASRGTGVFDAVDDKDIPESLVLENQPHEREIEVEQLPLKNSFASQMVERANPNDALEDSDLGILGSGRSSEVRDLVSTGRKMQGVTQGCDRTIVVYTQPNENFASANWAVSDEDENIVAESDDFPGGLNIYDQTITDLCPGKPYYVTTNSGFDGYLYVEADIQTNFNGEFVGEVFNLYVNGGPGSFTLPLLEEPPACNGNRDAKLDIKITSKNIIDSYNALYVLDSNDEIVFGTGYNDEDPSDISLEATVTNLCPGSGYRVEIQDYYDDGIQVNNGGYASLLVKSGNAVLVDESLVSEFAVFGRDFDVPKKPATKPPKKRMKRNMNRNMNMKKKLPTKKPTRNTNMNKMKKPNNMRR